MVRARGSVGGAHEVFWGAFSALLSVKTDQILLGHLAPRDAQDIYLKLESLRSILNRGPSVPNNWLSYVSCR
jgi:hypothetical protein